MDLLAVEKNICNDKWLYGLVDAMEEVSGMRSDDICRSAVAPRALIAQLRQRQPVTEPAIRIAA
jgi:hypothetical protein